MFAGLSLDCPRIMGIVNVTPDSFSDGGETFACEDAVRRGLTMLEDGADIIDVGGESTRPGATQVGLDEEIRRTVPVIEHLVKAGAVVSVDTRHALVMQAALDVGATIVNDVSALTGEGALNVVARARADVVLMHMQGLPLTMQDNPQYCDAAFQVLEYLKERVRACNKAGIESHRIAIDPGIGFGKTVEDNVQILARLNDYAALDLAVLVGVSRKSFIGVITGEPKAKNRLAGSLAAALWAVQNGAHILRVHDVAETVQALKIWSTLKRTTET